MSQTAILAKADATGLPWSFRNKVINGDMRIDQVSEGSSITVTSASLYNVDMMIAGMSGANGTAQRVSSGLPTIPYAVRLTGTAGTTTSWFGTYIESVDSTTLVGKKVTVSFYAAASALTGLTINLKSFNVLDVKTAVTLVDSTTKTINSSLTLYSFTSSVDMTSAVANGLYLEFVPTGSLGTGTFTITGLQLEEGSKATPFEVRPYSVELAMCQRYFEKGKTNYYTGATTAHFGQTTFYKTTKRATPILTITDNVSNVGKITVITNATGLSADNYAYSDNTGTGNLPKSGHQILYVGGSSLYGYIYSWTADARL